MTSAPWNRALSLASALARGSRRQIEKRLEEARYHIGIDLGRTNSSVAVVPFLDSDCAYPRDTELNRVSSIFGAGHGEGLGNADRLHTLSRRQAWAIAHGRRSAARRGAAPGRPSRWRAR